MIECYLVDLERSVLPDHIVYWKGNKRGYVSNKQEAGVFKLDAALEIAMSDIEYKTLILPIKGYDRT